MKKITSFVFTALLLSAFSIQAQTIDEIAAKYVEALGGKEKLASLKTVKMSGSLSAQGMDIAISMTKSHMEGVRLDFELMGNNNYQLANNQKGWEFMPVMGMTDPVEMDAEKLNAFKSQMDLHGPFVDYKEKGITLELLGKEKVDGAEAYKIKVVQNNKTTTQYISVSSNRLVKTSGKVTAQGQEMDVETSFSDYKQNADGYWFAYTIANMQGPITFEKIETNVKVDPKIFTN